MSADLGPARRQTLGSKLALLAVAMGSCGEGERALTLGVLDGLSAGMLCLADRGFYSFSLWNQARSGGAELLWRMKGSQRLPVLERNARPYRDRVAGAGGGWRAVWAWGSVSRWPSHAVAWIISCVSWLAGSFVSLRGAVPPVATAPHRATAAPTGFLRALRRR